MLRLKNVKIENNIASAEFVPENSAQHGEIVVDLLSEEIVRLRPVDGYGDSYHGHAKWRLIEMARINDTITECIVMWY